MRECVRETITAKSFIMLMLFLFLQGNHILKLSVLDLINDNNKINNNLKKNQEVIQSVCSCCKYIRLFVYLVKVSGLLAVVLW